MGCGSCGKNWVKPIRYRLLSEKMEPDLSKKLNKFFTVNTSVKSHRPRLNIREKTIDGISISTLLRRFGSPLFVVSSRALAASYKNLSTWLSRLYPNSIVAYSMKTNNLPGICRLFKNQGVIAEVVSSYEYWLAKKLGFKGREIIFNGPNKGNKAIKSALFSGAKVHVDNPDELNYLLSLSASRNKKTKIGIRVNPLSENQSRFGFCIRSGEAEAAIRQISEHPNVRLSGIHFHIGSNVFPSKCYQEATEMVCQFILKFKNLLLPNLQYLDVGGGFPVPGSGAFDDADKTYTIVDYLKRIIEPINRFRLDQLHLIVEPGRYLIDEPIVLLATVISNRIIKTVNNVTVDASLSILPLAQTRRQRVAVIRNIPIRSSSIKTAPRQTTIYGSSCVEIDWLAKGIFSPMTDGDNIVFYNAGAYNISQSNQFISPRPAVIMINNLTIRVLRCRERFEDLIRLDRQDIL